MERAIAEFIIDYDNCTANSFSVYLCNIGFCTFCIK